MEFIDYLLNRSGLSWRTLSKSARDELDRFIVEEWEYGMKRTFRGDERDDINLQVPRRATSVIGRLRRTSSTLSIKPFVFILPDLEPELIPMLEKLFSNSSKRLWRLSNKSSTHNLWP